jgi:hypothetical protein
VAEDAATPATTNVSKAPAAAAAAAVATPVEDVAATRTVKSLRGASSSSKADIGTATGSRKLLGGSSSSIAARKLAAAAAALQAEAVYAICTTEEYLASADAIMQKLKASAEPPGYVFYSNLQVRRVDVRKVV